MIVTFSILFYFHIQLHKLLDFKELQEFATLLKSYRDKMPVEEFISKLQVLYGAQRAFLIPGEFTASSMCMVQQI